MPREGLAAGAAGEGPLPRVGPLVPEHTVFFVAREGAEAAPMPALRVSLRPVSLQEVPGGEVAVAVPAREGL